jgi:hypothetical protein
MMLTTKLTAQKLKCIPGVVFFVARIFFCFQENDVILSGYLEF